MELTMKQVERLQYRKERLAEKANRLEFLLSGRGVSLLPLVRTKGGRYSEKRAWALVEDLLAALEKYEAYLQCLEDEEDEDRPLAEIACHLPEQEQAFYRSFLYCAVRVAESNPFWIWGRRGVFHDILDLAESAAIYREKIELHFDELYWGPSGEPSGQFFDCMDRLYEAFTGTPVTDALPEEDRREAEERVRARKKKDEEDWAAFLEDAGMTEEEYEAANLEMLEQFGGIVEQGPVEAQRDERQKQAWIKAFPNKEALCQQYLMCRELYFQADRSQLADNLENMLDFYLYEHGESSYLQDDTFFYAYALLDKVLRQVRDLTKAEGAR